LKGEGRVRVKGFLHFIPIPLPLPPPTRGGDNLWGALHPFYSPPLRGGVRGG